uniref:Uncharacterized protein n=1 Tax=Strongyloides venezuelensis TaxID=75913 RepID=A0A0K0G643_STRVS
MQRIPTWISSNQKIKEEINYLLGDELLVKGIKDVRALQKHTLNSDYNPLILKLEFEELTHRLKFKNNKVNLRPDLNKIDPMKLKEHLILDGRKATEALATLINNHAHLILD